MQVVFNGSVQDGKLLLDNKPEFIAYLHTLNGKRVNVSVEKQTRRRSNEQNAYYHGVILNMISKETGQDPQSLHEAFKYKFSEKITLKGLVIPQSTRTRDTISFSEYCESIRQWAREFLNLDIPDPKPKTDA
jgi:hypothetical protein